VAPHAPAPRAVLGDVIAGPTNPGAKMRTTTLAFPLLLACKDPAAVPAPVAPVDTDPVAQPEDSTEPPADPPAPVDWVVEVWPPKPAYNDDLVCVAFGLPLNTPLRVAWSVNETAWEEGDVVVPHLNQAGGQRWSCRVQLNDGSERISAPVTIGAPVEMVELPPGSYKHSAWINYPHYLLGDQSLANPNQQVELTRHFLMATLEITNAYYYDTMGYLPEIVYTLLGDTERPIADHPVHMLRYSEAAAFANVLSRLDGLPECFTCTGVGADVTCEFITDPAIYDCTGYRLPTGAEWEYAYSSAGQREGMLPAGGSWYSPAPEYVDDMEVSGPGAPPGSRISDQCYFVFYRTENNRQVTAPVGSRNIPSLQGIHDLCGNAHEIVLDQPYGRAAAARIIDPLSSYPEGPGRSVSGYEQPMNTWPTQFAGGETSFGGIRLVRTNTPLGGAP
jgi:formylglycine-generating enzyme required for sulfatase activity